MDPARVTVELEDRCDLIELALKWSAAASRMDAHGLGEIFTEDAHLAGVTQRAPGWSPDDLVGPRKIEEFFSAIFKVLALVHHSSQVAELKIDGDRATATTTITEYCRFTSGQLLLVFGDYIDEMARTPRGWLFTRRELVTKAWTVLAEGQQG
jgi:hypothetical protein